MTVRADWFVADLQDLLDEEPDPFNMPIEEIGTPIDLSDPQGRLELRYGELMEREGNLFNCGITCSIKIHRDSTCLACPSEIGNPESTLAPLCRIGREQERVLTDLVRLRCQSPSPAR